MHATEPEKMPAARVTAAGGGMIRKVGSSNTNANSRTRGSFGVDVNLDSDDDDDDQNNTKTVEIEARKSEIAKPAAKGVSKYARTMIHTLRY